jgi:hypothetical protein
MIGRGSRRRRPRLALVAALSALVLLGPASAGTTRLAASAPRGEALRGGSPQHWIGVRTVNGVQQLFDRRTGQKFVPRGANYQRLVMKNGVRVSGLFSPSTWKPAAIDADLQEMHDLGFNVVRSFLDLCVQDCITNANGLRGAYLDHVVDYLRMARGHGIAVLLASVDVPDAGYMVHAPCCSPFGGYRNSLYLSAKGQQIGVDYLTDVLHALKMRHAPLHALMAFEVQQEEFVLGDVEPLSLSTGHVHTADGKTYDMSSQADKRAMVNSNVRLFAKRARAGIRAIDPGMLVTMGFFPPQGDERIVYPKAMLQQSALDFIDFHAYPGGPTMQQTAQTFGMTKPTPRPVVMGELGAFRFYLNAHQGAWELAAWQAQSCAVGFAGWIHWLWAKSDVEVYGGEEDGGIVNHELAPATRPNPCSASGVPRNRSIGATATATSSLPGQGPSRAIDNSWQTIWNAGAGPPQHIDVTLTKPFAVDQIQLRVAQDPAGPTEHRILVRGATGGFRLVRTFTQDTEGDDWLVFFPRVPLQNVRTVRVSTVSSPSWVAWAEIVIYAH